MSSVYDQHRAAFARVDAAVVLHKGERVATIALRYPQDGAGRLYAYVHWLGIEMVRGWASGGGYDKRTAACSAAARKLTSAAANTPGYVKLGVNAFENFRDALAKDDGWDWDRALTDAGFVVLRAI